MNKTVITTEYKNRLSYVSKKELMDKEDIAWNKLQNVLMVIAGSLMTICLFYQTIIL